MALSRAQRIEVEARFATAIRLLVEGAKLTALNGRTAAALIRRGFLTRSTVNANGQTWLNAYSGPFAPAEEVLITTKRQSRSPRPKPAPAPKASGLERVRSLVREHVPPPPDIRQARAKLLVQAIVEHPQDWVFLHRGAASNCDLSADDLGVLAFVAVLRDGAGKTVTLDSLAKRFPEMGKTGLRRSLGILRDAGYVLNVELE